LGAVLLVLAAGPARADTCSESLQAKINAAPAGGTVVAEPCIYREELLIDKRITLSGQPGSEIRGSDVWQGWVYRNSYWRSKNVLPEFPQPEVFCMPKTKRCQWPEQVFLDGKPLRQVASEPKSGEFAVDPESRRVILRNDPTGRLVEVSVRRHWILGTKTADGVTIEGFTMKHAATEGRSAALMNRQKRLTLPGEEGTGSGSGWVVQNNRLSDAHGAVISLKHAPGLKILNNHIFRGGQLGIHGAGNGEIIQGNHIHHNNTEDFTYQAYLGMGEAGGIKVGVYVRDTLVDSNMIYNNKGHGIHYDDDTDNNVLSNNRIYRNARKGIQYELSTGGKIFGNVFYENGWATPKWVDGSAITLSNSSTTEVYDNVLAWNADGITVLGQNRAGTTHDFPRDIYIHDNIIITRDYASDPRNNFALAWLQEWSGKLYDLSYNNRGENNLYWYPKPEGSLVRYEWKQEFSRLADFNRTRGEEKGRYLTDQQKATVLESNGIPANPLPRG
jgi:parallel beta-helix repeat protein